MRKSSYRETAGAAKRAREHCQTWSVMLLFRTHRFETYYDSQGDQQSSIPPAVVLTSDERQSTESEENGAEECCEPVHVADRDRCKARQRRVDE